MKRVFYYCSYCGQVESHDFPSSYLPSRYHYHITENAQEKAFILTVLATLFKNEQTGCWEPLKEEN